MSLAKTESSTQGTMLLIGQLQWTPLKAKAVSTWTAPTYIKELQ